jgi:KaiC/GvpD/RAD55 family RecA-like ATPase
MSPKKEREVAAAPPVDRRPTGVGGLDFNLGGGIPFGTSIIVYGTPYSGIELMAKQFWQAEETPGTYLMLDSVVEDGMIDARGVPAGDLAPRFTGQRVVVDSISSLVARDGIDAVIQLMTTAIRPFLAAGGNAMFVMYPHLSPPFEEMRIVRAADVYIALIQDLHGNEIQRALAVYKMKGVAISERVIPFIITEKGLELSTTSRVV